MNQNGYTLKLAASVLAGLMLSGMAWGEGAQKTDPRFVTKDDTVYDKKSRLTWERCSVGQHWKAGTGCEGNAETFTFDEARKLRRGGWRVPTRDELETLVGETGSRPALAADVENIQDIGLGKQALWTTTPSSVGGDWGIYFDGERFLHAKRIMGFAVRLVQGGQKP